MKLRIPAHRRKGLAISLPIIGGLLTLMFLQLPAVPPDLYPMALGMAIAVTTTAIATILHWGIEVVK